MTRLSDMHLNQLSSLLVTRGHVATLLCCYAPVLLRSCETVRVGPCVCATCTLRMGEPFERFSNRCTRTAAHQHRVAEPEQAWAKRCGGGCARRLHAPIKVPAGTTSSYWCSGLARLTGDRIIYVRDDSDCLCVRRLTGSSLSNRFCVASK